MPVACAPKKREERERENWVRSPRLAIRWRLPIIKSFANGDITRAECVEDVFSRALVVFVVCFR